MIVKVQLPIVTTEEVPLALIYNQDRSVTRQVPVDNKLKKAMGISVKKFFFAKIEDDKIKLGKIAAYQEW